VTHDKRVSQKRPLLSVLFRFGLTGALGFAVDAGVLHLVVALWNTGLYLARACSFACAVTVTWLINRSVTFSATRAPRRGLFAEWAAYVVASLGGGCVNYGAFAIAIRVSPLLHQFPTIAVGIGTIAGTVFNFVMYARYVFPAHVD
jgi:putative flippase GtrA